MFVSSYIPDAELHPFPEPTTRIQCQNLHPDTFQTIQHSSNPGYHFIYLELKLQT